MKKFITKILDFFTIIWTKQHKALTNKALVRELTEHFRARLEEESVGQRMLYPMSFNILMTPEDYSARQQALPFILPEVVSAFYDIIESMSNHYPNFTPPANYWYFQFSACKQGPVDTKDAPLIVRPGHIATMATLMTFDIQSASNVSVDTNTRISIKMDDSHVMNDVNMNWNAIKDLDILSEGSFKFKFDPTLNRKIEHIQHLSVGSDILATLTYTHDGKNITYDITQKLIEISGKEDDRNTNSIFKIESDNVQTSHVQIKYIADDKQFYIAAFGQTNLNGRKLKISSGGDIIWTALADNSKIFINDVVSLKFHINK